MSKNNYQNYQNYSNANSKVEEPVKETSVVTEEPVVEETEVEEAAETEVEDAVAEKETDEVSDVTEEPEVEKTEVIGTVINCDKLRVRAIPNTSASIVCEIYKDSEVEIIESESTGDFYKVVTSAGAVGYCMKDYIAIK